MTSEVEKLWVIHKSGSGLGRGTVDPCHHWDHLFDLTLTWLFSLLSASDARPFPTPLSPLSGPARGTHSIFSYFRGNSFHMCLIHLRLQKLEISSVQIPFQLFFPFPFLETGSCVWLRQLFSVLLRLRRCLEWGTVRSGEGFFTFFFAGTIEHHLPGNTRMFWSPFTESKPGRKMFQMGQVSFPLPVLAWSFRMHSHIGIFSLFPIVFPEEPLSLFHGVSGLVGNVKQVWLLL